MSDRRRVRGGSSASSRLGAGGHGGDRRRRQGHRGQGGLHAERRLGSSRAERQPPLAPRTSKNLSYAAAISTSRSEPVSAMRPQAPPGDPVAPSPAATSEDAQTAHRDVLPQAPLPPLPPQVPLEQLALPPPPPGMPLVPPFGSGEAASTDGEGSLDQRTAIYPPFSSMTQPQQPPLPPHAPSALSV